MGIEIKGLNYTYQASTALANVAIENVDLNIKDGVVLAVIGETGSGKSTLVQHLNGLLKPTKGKLIIDDFVIEADVKATKLKQLKKHVGLVFQFPEYQLFEETVLKDVMFGPKNFGVSEEDAKKIALEKLAYVGLSSDTYTKSPFELSGGQKRRVAIAGILAMDPSVIILDEPTAGLDPQGSKEIMDLFMKLNKEEHKTVIMVTHDMEHVLTYCDEVALMAKGQLVTHESVSTFMQSASRLRELGIDPPMLVQAKEFFEAKGMIFENDVLSVEDLITQVEKEMKL